MSVAGSDKHGGPVSHSHVSEKAELVPIKKRRFLYRSYSPPRISSPLKEKRPKPGEEKANQDHPVIVLSALSTSELDDSANLHTDACHNSPKEVNESLECNDDCLSLLADAACSTSLPVDTDNPIHGLGMMRSKVIGVQSEEFTTNCKMESLHKEMIRRDLQVSSKIGTDSPVATNSTGELPSISVPVPGECSGAGKITEETSSVAYFDTVPCDDACEKGEAVGSRRQHSPDERLHWDLNVVMDVWEQPFDCSVANTPDLESGHILNNSKSLKTMGSSDQIVKHKISEFVNIKQSACEPERPVDQGLRHNSGHCGDIGDDQKQPLDICQRSLKMPSSCKNNVPMDHKDRLNGVHFVKSLNFDGAPSDPADLKFELDETCSVAAEDTTFEKNVGSADILGQRTVDGPPSDSCHVKVEHDAKSLNSVRVPSDVSPETYSVKAEDITHTKNANGSSFIDSEVCLSGSSRPVILRHSFTDGTSGNEYIDKKVCPEEGRDADLTFPVSHDSDVMDIVDMGLTSGGKIEAVPSSERIKAKTQIVAQNSITKVTADPSGTTSSLRINYDEFMKLSDRRKGLDTSDQKSNFYILSERHSTLGSESEGEPMDGYDSQYEDGELRELSGHGWEENEALDGEAEHVEYQLINMNNMPSRYNTDDGQDKVASPLVSQIDSELTTTSNRLMMMEHNVEDNLISKISGDEAKNSMVPDEQLGVDKDSSAAETSARDDGEGVRVFSRAGRFTASDNAENNAHTKGLSRVLPSQIDGPISHGPSFREERMGGTCSRWERESGYRGRFQRGPRFYMQGEAKTGQVDDHVGYPDGRRGFRRHYSPTYHSHANSVTTAATEDGKEATMNAASYVDQPLSNDDFAADGDRGTGFQPGSTSNEEISSTRPMGRGRFIRYGPKMDHRVGRGRYQGSYPDDYQTSMKYRRPFSRRERSDSPAAGRRGCTLNRLPSQGRSPSRSGTRSPNLRTSPKGRFGPGNYRDTYLRNRSRSPNFRSDLRMIRRRSPNPQAGFLTDHPRVRPPCKEQLWICDRNDEPGDFRDLGYKHRDIMLNRSPERPRLRGVFDGARNSRPDAFYRSPPARLPEDEGPSRGFRADENDENRRKQFGPPYSSRRGLENGNGRRLRHTDDNVDSHFGPSYRNVTEFRGRGVRSFDNRMEDMPQRYRREQRFMYDQDGKFDADLKPFRFNRMDPSRNMKPGEHHRSFRPRRLGEADRAGNGNRYMENYEDRRERHGLSHPFRSDETESTGTESTGKRLDHGVDGDTVGQHYTCSQDDPGSLISDAKRIDHVERD